MITQKKEIHGVKQTGQILNVSHAVFDHLAPKQSRSPFVCLIKSQLCAQWAHTNTPPTETVYYFTQKTNLGFVFLIHQNKDKPTLKTQ